MYNPTEVAERINSLLKQKSIQQKEMLESCGLNKNAISSMISRGSMLRADNLAHIADYLECSVDFLLGRSDISALAKKEAPAENTNAAIPLQIPDAAKELANIYMSLDETTQAGLLKYARYLIDEKADTPMEVKTNLA